MRNRNLSLTKIVPVIVGFIVAVAAGAYLVTSIWTVSKTTRDQLVAGNRAMLSVSTRLMFNPLYESDVWTLNNMLNEFTDETNILHAAIRDLNGAIIAESTANEWSFGEQIAQGLAYKALTQREIVNQEIENQLILIGPIATGPEQIGTLELVFDLSEFQASLIRTTIYTVLITLAFLVIAVLISSIVFRHYILSPINALVNAAGEIGRGNLDTPIPEVHLEEPTALVSALEQMRANLQELYQNLEAQVENLERRARYQEATAAVARDAASALDVQELVSQAITLVDERFDFYRQGIFLLDPNDDWVVLQAASGEGVQQILEQGNRLRVGQEGIIGYVSQTGEAYVAQNVLKDPIFVPDAGSADIRSELALPLRTRGEIIGVLSVQSQELEAFSDEDIAVLQTMADLIAVAISNVRLLQQTQDNLEAISRAYGELSQETWIEMLRTQTNIGYYSDGSGVTPIDETVAARIDHKLPSIEIPVEVRGHTIGKIHAHKTESAGEWTAEEAALMNSMVEQLNLALESARLFEDTQHRAVQEQMTSEITARMRETLDIETVLQTATKELRNSLDLAEVEIRLGADPGEKRQNN